MSVTPRFAGWLALLTRRPIVDDRGTRVGAARIYPMIAPFLGPVVATEHRERIRKGFSLRRAIRERGWPRYLVLVCALVGCFCGYLGLLLLGMRLILWTLFRSTGPGSPLLLAIATTIAVFGTIFALQAAVMTPIYRWFWSDIIADAILKARLCPTCGYSLDNATIEPDGCTICPECGAAWKLPALRASPAPHTSK